MTPPHPGRAAVLPRKGGVNNITQVGSFTSPPYSAENPGERVRAR
ncbi:hypothetical protein ACFQX7_11940 [Luedemannella flava]